MALMAITYGVFFWLFLRFLAVDACVDAGGVFEAASSSCLNFRPDEFRPLLERPWTFWLFAIVIPALPVAAFGFLVRRLLPSHA